MTQCPDPKGVIEALSIPRAGKIFDLSIVLDNRTSMWPGHGHFTHLVSVNHRQGEALLSKGFDRRIGMMTDRVEMPLHAGTHIDALNHFSIEGTLAGDQTTEDSEVGFVEGRGHASGIDSAPLFVGVGVVLDFTNANGNGLGAGDEITPLHIRDAMAAQGIHRLPRDGAVLLHTGWMRHFSTSSKTYFSGEPGIGLDAATMLRDAGVRIVGADNHALEATPASWPRESGPYPVHQELLVRSGVFIIENLVTFDLVRAASAEFLFIVLPLRIRGASGSPIRPIAVI